VINFYRCRMVICKLIILYLSRVIHKITPRGNKRVQVTSLIHSLCMTVSFTYSLLLFFICFLDLLLLLLLLFISFITSYPVYFPICFILLSPASFHVKSSHWSVHTQSCTSQDTHNPADVYDTHDCANSQDTLNFLPYSETVKYYRHSKPSILVFA